MHDGFLSINQKSLSDRDKKLPAYVFNLDLLNYDENFYSNNAVQRYMS